MQSTHNSTPDSWRFMEISTLLESMPEGVLIVDAEGKIVDVNGAAERFVGRSKDELRHTSIAELERAVSVPSGPRVFVFPQYAAVRALKGESIRNERRTFRSADGNDSIEALVSASPIRNDGKIVGAVVVVRDITEVTDLQRRLSDTERHRAIGQMAASLAHDFNNVLDTIEKATTVVELKASASLEERRAFLQIIHTAVARGAEIIDRLRQYLRDRSTEVKPVDLHRLLQETVDMTRPLLHQVHSIGLDVGLDKVAMIRANAPDLRRVFTNLIMNAVEAMPNGGKLTVHLREQDDLVRVDVCDTGVGIPREQQKKIFYPYFTTKQSGTGLGLSSAQKIVLSYGGTISVHSDVGQGTRFTIKFPKAAPAKSNGNGSRHEVSARDAKRAVPEDHDKAA